MKRAAWLLPFALAGACAGNEDTNEATAPPPGASDAGDAGTDAASDADGATTPTGCAGDWCSIEEARVARLSVNAIWGSRSADVWIVGGRGLVLHWDGQRLEERAPSTNPQVYTALWGTGPDDVWAMSSTSSAFHFTKGPDSSGHTAESPRWVETSFGGGVHAPVNAVFGTAPDDVYVVTAEGYQEVDYGGTLGYADLPSQLWHRTERTDGGSEWAELTPRDRTCPQTCPSFRTLWAADRRGQWIGGTFGTIFRAGEATAPPLRPVESNAVSTFAAMSGTSANDVWAVGDIGTVRHWQGERWEIVAVPTHASLRSVWAAAPDDVWIAGKAGTLIHYDGARWETITLPESARDRELRAVWGSAKTDVWAGGDGILLHRTLGGAP